MNKLMTALTLAGCAVTATDAVAEKLETADFALAQNVTFSGYAGQTALTNFPALVRVSSAIASQCAENGDDIRFADADGNLIPHEIDSWTPGGESLVWVRVPALSGNATKVTMYFKGVPTQEVDAADVWGGADYKLVYHFTGTMAETKGADYQRYDSSPNHLTASKTDGAMNFTEPAAVGSGWHNYGGTHLTVTNDARWAGTADEMPDITVSCWAKLDGNFNYRRLVSCKGNYDWKNGFELSNQAGVQQVNAIANWNNQHIVDIEPSLLNGFVYITSVIKTPEPGHHYSVIYINGKKVGTSASASFGIYKPDRCLRIGSTAADSPDAGNAWYGQIDEVRLQWRPQGDDWVAADYATQHDADFATYGAVREANPVKIDGRDFAYRCKVTFSGYAGAERLVNFPALVRIPAASGIAAKCGEGGGEIRFADADGNLIPHEIDMWNPSGESTIWVQVPELYGKDTFVTMHYRFFRPAAYEVVASDVWRQNGYKGVWHFSDNSCKDSSPNGFEATAGGSCNIVDGGKIGAAVSFSGDGYLEVANDARWAGTADVMPALTVSCWAKTDEVANYKRLISAKGYYDWYNGFELANQEGPKQINAIANYTNQHIVNIEPSLLDGFVYLTAIYKDYNVTIYANGVKIGTSTSGTFGIAKPNSVLRIGATAQGPNEGGASNFWKGQVDEVRLCWSAQSEDWAAADYATQSQPDFAVLGAVETPGFGIIIR